MEMSDLMQENYFNYYILSYFKVEKVTRISQILHVLRGKRTPSMFYLTEISHWHHGFLTDNRIERGELEKIIKSFSNNNLLLQKEKGYLLTAEGKERLVEYFAGRYYPNKIKCFSNLSLRNPYWDRLQLFTQVFSEYSYENSKYIPTIKNPAHQENVKQLFRAVDGNIDFILNQWMKEQECLFAQMDELKADVLVNLLTGHKKIGKTQGQIAKELKMEVDEFSFYLRDVLEELIQSIKENRKEFPMLYEILKQTNEEVFLGLSQSTYQSYQMLQQGANIHQVASYRNIKENTVKEHILEMAFILEIFPVQNFMSEQIYEYLNQQFEKQEDYSFKQAVTSNKAIEFYQFRLVELERMRSN